MATRIVFGPATPPPVAPPSGSSAVSYVTRMISRSLDDGVTVREAMAKVAEQLEQRQWGTFTVEHGDGETQEIRVNRDQVQMLRPGDASSWAADEVGADASTEG